MIEQDINQADRLPYEADRLPYEVDCLPDAVDLHDEEATVLAEYGLTLVVVGTIAAIFLRFVNSGSVLDLLTDVLGQARALVGL